jgi:nucleoside-diphosphate-sugar epimerase
MTPRLLVTGGTGFVGRPCVNRSAARGAEVHILARAGQGERFHAADLFHAQRVGDVIADIRPTHLLHLAWVTTPGEYWNSPENERWVGASLALLSTFAENGGRRAVLAGSCAEYDWSGPGLCHEFETPLQPATLYGRCKSELFERAGRTRVSLAWARLFHLYGPGEHPTRLVASVARSLLAGDPAECTRGNQSRDFLHVADAADALVSLLFTDVTGPVNVASGSAVPVRDVTRLIGEVVGRPDLLRLGARPTPSGEPRVLFADVSRLSGEVGWRPRIGLAEGIADAVSSWRNDRMAA